MPKPPDKVQLIKQESTAGGGDPTDNDELYLESPLDPTEDAPEVQGVFFQDKGGGQSNDENVYITRDGDDLVFNDKTVASEVILNDLLATVQHKALRQLIHFIDQGPADGFVSGAEREQLPVGSFFPTSIIWYEDSSHTQKIVEKTIAYPTLVTPTPITWKMYDGDGSTVLVTVQDDITYSGIVEHIRVRTIIV